MLENPTTKSLNNVSGVIRENKHTWNTTAKGAIILIGNKLIGIHWPHMKLVESNILD